jgi:invasion protein IalB
MAHHTGRNRFGISILAFALAFGAAHAHAQQFDKAFKDWNVFSIDQNGQKTCYIASAPTKKDGNTQTRDEPYMLVTSRSAAVDEVSVSSGYPYKEKSEVDIKVDKNRATKFFSKDSLAWAYTEDADKEMVRQMRKGSKMLVSGTSEKGTKSSDTYSLSGFGNAYDRMKELCK